MNMNPQFNNFHGLNQNQYLIANQNNQFNNNNLNFNLGIQPNNQQIMNNNNLINSQNQPNNNLMNYQIMNNQGNFQNNNNANNNMAQNNYMNKNQGNFNNNGFANNIINNNGNNFNNNLMNNNMNNKNNNIVNNMNNMNINMANGNMNNKINNMNNNMINSMNNNLNNKIYNMNNNMINSMNNMNNNMNNKNNNINNNMINSMNNMNNNMNNKNNNMNNNMIYSMNNMNNNNYNGNVINNPIPSNNMNMNLNNKMNNVNKNMGNINPNQMMNNEKANFGNNMNVNNSMNNNNNNNINNFNCGFPNNINVNQNINNGNNNKNNFSINMNIIPMNKVNNNNMMGNMNPNNLKYKNNNNPSIQFVQNFNDFKVDFSNFNFNNSKNAFKDVNQIMKDKEAQTFSNEIETISNKLKVIFSQDELAKLMNEEDLLKYFSQEEEEMLKFVDDNFGGLPFLKNYTLDEIKLIFDENPVINHISVDINMKVQGMDLSEFKSEKEFRSKIQKKFKNIKIPQFLIEPSIKELNTILFYSGRKKETATIINNIQQKNSSNISILLNIQLENIRKNLNFFLQGINCRKELIYLFLLLNNLELKGRIWLKFFNYFLISEPLVKMYFSNNFSHTQIFQEINNMNELNLREKIENLYLAIDYYIGNNENLIHNIIVSFYFFLFYVLKTSQNANDRHNIGNTILNLSLKNFVIFLDTKFKNKLNSNENLYQSLKELYIYDVLYLVNLNTIYPQRNLMFNFKQIDSVLSTNNKVRQSYEELKKQYQSNEGEGLFTKISKNLHLGEGRDFTTFEKYIKLLQCDEIVFTNTITIIIDGFTTEESNPMDKWKDFVQYFNKESMFYFYKWPSDSPKNIISHGIRNALRFGSQNFSSASERAKICGKILAYIIYSNEIFKNFQINLVGFSLGNHVIKHCIKELYELNKASNQDIEDQVYLKNVILIAAATTLKDKSHWVTYAKTLITDKFKNCYSQKDDVLKILYGLCMMKTAVGRNELILSDGDKNYVENYNFTPYNYGHLSYNMGVVAREISGKYKEI